MRTYVSMSNLSDGERARSSKDTVLYACDCANCKRTLFYCYVTLSFEDIGTSNLEELLEMNN